MATPIILSDSTLLPQDFAPKIINLGMEENNARNNNNQSYDVSNMEIFLFDYYTCEYNHQVAIYFKLRILSKIHNC